MNARKRFKTTLLGKITKFKNAAIDDSWKGNQPPECRDDIEKCFEMTRNTLVNFIMKEYDQLTLKGELGDP